MIGIRDDDTPMMVANQIIYGEKGNNDSHPYLMDKRNPNMYSLEEIKEIATYLFAYYDLHKEDD